MLQGRIRLMDVSEIIKKLKPSLPVILVANGENKIVSKGSGFIFQKSDLVVTCAHVVSSTEDINVVLQFPDNEGTFVPAKVVITDHEHDIALLKFQPDKEREPLALASNESTEGMAVLFSGYPFSLMNLTTHQGIISSVITDPTGMKRYLIDGTINPGNSGGPLMNMKGEVIGVVDATRRESNDILSKVQAMSTGALSLHGLDLVELYNALVNNLQLGVGYAVPSSYIPHYPDHDDSDQKEQTTKKPTGGKK
ncbi:MAG TPA: serine protease [Candidatus Saccharimonadales bacterium]|nr:serine protease [Candidatus Saccharimonadales bacterium]